MGAGGNKMPIIVSRTREREGGRGCKGVRRLFQGIKEAWPVGRDQKGSPPPSSSAPFGSQQLHTPDAPSYCTPYCTVYTQIDQEEKLEIKEGRDIDLFLFRSQNFFFLNSPSILEPPAVSVKCGPRRKNTTYLCTAARLFR